MRKWHGRALQFARNHMPSTWKYDYEFTLIITMFNVMISFKEGNLNSHATQVQQTGWC